MEAGVVQLKSSQSIGEDIVQQEESRAQQAIQKNAGKDLYDLEQVMAAQQSADQKGKALTKYLAREFQGQLDHFQTASEKNTGAFTDQIVRLTQNAPDFQAMFNDDTADSRNEIEAAHHRIDSATTWTEGVMQTYQQKLEDVRHQREEEATQIHGKVSEVKNMVVDEAEKTVDMVEQIREKLAKSKQQMADQLAQFKNQLSQLSTVSSEHDQEDLDALEMGMVTLEAGHNRLSEKVAHYFHYDRAFNEEVEGQLRAMGKAIDSDDVNAEGEELNQEKAVNNQLKILKDRFGEEVANVYSANARAYGNLAKSLENGVQGVLTAGHAGTSATATANQRTQDLLNKKAQSQEQQMAEVRDKESELEREAGMLRKATAEAQAEVESGFLLPKLSSAPEMVETDEKYQDLAYRMKSQSMGAPQSLLETGGQGTAATGQSSDSAEEKAIASLNSELYRENEKLASQNARLQSRLGKAWEYLAEHNVTEAVRYVKQQLAGSA